MSKNRSTTEWFASKLDRLADEFDRARDKSVKPRHLATDARRAVVQAGRLAFDVAKAEMIPGQQAMCKHWVGAATLLFHAPFSDDDDGNWRAWVFFRLAVLPGVRHMAGGSALKANAGAFDWPPPLTDKQGRLLGKNGKPARVHYFDSKGQRVSRARWKSMPPSQRGGWALRDVASVVDRYDEQDMLAHLRTQAGDYADACRALAELLRGTSGTELPPVLRLSTSTQQAWYRGKEVRLTERPRAAFVFLLTLAQAAREQKHATYKAIDSALTKGPSGNRVAAIADRTQARDALRKAFKDIGMPKSTFRGLVQNVQNVGYRLDIAPDDIRIEDESA